MAQKRRPVAVVDGANVAYAERTRDGKPRVSNITAMRATLEHGNWRPIVIVDAALRHEIDDPQQLNALIDRHIVHQAPAGTAADYFVIRTAAEENGIVVSNDTYREYRVQYPWIDERRLPFMIVNGRVELYRPTQPTEGKTPSGGQGQP